MATINLGRIKPVFRGAYAGGTAYVVDDIVTHGNETFICIQAGTGNATSNASYWTKLAAKGTDGTDVGTTLTTQGDILYRDGSGLQRLAAGTSGQVLQTGGSGANPSWTTISGDLSASGSTQNVYKSIFSTAFSTSSTSYTDTGLELTLSTLTADTDFLVFFQTDRREQDWNGSSDRHMKSSDNGSNYTVLGQNHAWYRTTSNTPSESNIYHLATAQYYCSFTSGQTPKFIVQGRIHNGSNPYRINNGDNQSSIIAIKITP